MTGVPPTAVGTGRRFGRRSRTREDAFDRPRFLKLYSGLVYLYLFIPIVVVVLFSFNSVKSLQSFQGFSTQWYSDFLNDPTLRESLFVQAARSCGASGLRIVFRHIVPNSLSSLLVIASLDFGLVILTAAGLGFLGLGAQPPTPEWGLMVADGRKYLLDSPWFATFPGLTIMLVVIAANVVGDGLRDLLDPRLRG